MSNTIFMEEIYDDILKFYFRQDYLSAATPRVRKQFTGENWNAKLMNYVMPFAKFGRRYFEYKRTFEPYFTTENVGGKIWLFANSQNNRNSLKFLLEEFEDAILIGHGIPVEKTDLYQIPFYRAVLSIWKFPKIWQFFNKKYGNRASKYGDFLFQCVGLYEVAFQTLEKYRPKCLILANDHSEKQRALLNAAQRLNIPTVYIQHASISNFMPPLDFDLSLLEGQDSWDKYKKLGPIKGNVELIGMPKFDNYLPYRNTSNHIKSIGICTSSLDDIVYIKELLNTLQSNFPNIALTYRAHPIDNRKFDIPESIAISTKTEGIFDFLKRQDLLIAGSSSVHLEAILLNVTSIYFEMSVLAENMKDAYGYVKNGLIEQAENLEDLTKKVNALQSFRPNVFQNATYYNAVAGTIYEGKSSELATQYIRKFLEKY